MNAGRIGPGDAAPARHPAPNPAIGGRRQSAMQMQMRPLGRSGLQVSPLAFGGNVFGWTVDERTSFDLLDAWVDAGMNLVDTADV